MATVDSKKFQYGCRVFCDGFAFFFWNHRAVTFELSGVHCRWGEWLLGGE